MAIVVLGQHERQCAHQPFQPGRRLPTQLAGVAPPYVQLAQREAGQCAGP